MPVTAKLSRVFYERMGDQVADELVAWFNVVDDSYRKDLRDLNEVNFQRFDAKVEQRFAEADLRHERRFAEFDVKWEKRFTELDVKWEKRFAEFDVKWEKRFAELDFKWVTHFAELGGGVAALEAALRAEIRSAIAEAQKETIKYMFGFWTANLITTAGIVIAVLRYKG